MNQRKPRQLPLAVNVDNHCSFENFYTSAENQNVVACLQNHDSFLEHGLIYLWGSKGVGRSHLVRAVCNERAQLGKSILYAAMATREQATDFIEPPGDQNNVSKLSLLCIDDVELIAGDKAWEQKLFSVYNQCHDNGIPMLVVANCAPLYLPIQLADLQSRLQSGLVLRLSSYSDQQKIKLLQLRADKWGFYLPDKVAVYILSRTDRGVEALMKLLKKLDDLSLGEKRQKITLANVKDALD